MMLRTLVLVSILAAPALATRHTITCDPDSDMLEAGISRDCVKTPCVYDDTDKLVWASSAYWCSDQRYPCLFQIPYANATRTAWTYSGRLHAAYCKLDGSSDAMLRAFVREGFDEHD